VDHQAQAMAHLLEVQDMALRKEVQDMVARPPVDSMEVEDHPWEEAQAMVLHKVKEVLQEVAGAALHKAVLHPAMVALRKVEVDLAMAVLHPAMVAPLKALVALHKDHSMARCNNLEEEVHLVASSPRIWTFLSKPLLRSNQTSRGAPMGPSRCTSRVSG